MYKASIIGGGESSNQYISSMIFLAYHAKTCVTIFPPPPLFNATDGGKLQTTNKALDILKHMTQQGVISC